VDTSHTLVDQATGLRDLYVGASRGREANRLYVECRREPDEHHHERLDRPARAILDDIVARGDSPTASAAEIRRRAGEEAGRSLAEVGTQWDLLTAEYGRDRYTDALAAVLPAEVAVDAVIAEPGYSRLLRAVREAELGGHDAAALVGEAVEQRGLRDADSVSDVLRWRIHQQLPNRIAERDVGSGDWSALTPPMRGPVGEYVQVLAASAAHLGVPPDDQLQRAEWVRRAGVAAAYRELRSVPDGSISLGPAPSREQTFHRMLWQQAYTALGAPADALDYATASNTELRQMRAQWLREQAWAPHYVADELGAAWVAAESYRQDVILWRAEAQRLPDGSAGRAQALVEVAAAQQLAAEYTERAEQLAPIHAAREEWARDAEPVRERYLRAGEELERRGLAIEA
jgi:hypothetical protein